MGKLKAINTNPPGACPCTAPLPAARGEWAEQRVLSLLARQWNCRCGELDLVLEKAGRLLLLVEVKGRRRCGPDRWGVADLHRGKRLRLKSMAPISDLNDIHFLLNARRQLGRRPPT